MDNDEDFYERHFFSECSGREFDSIISSQSASCLNKPNHVTIQALLDPDFDNYLVSTTIQEECRNRLIEQHGHVNSEDVSNCKKVRCSGSSSNMEIIFTPQDNTKCGLNRVKIN